MYKLKKGFTLIELLVVIAIVGILATTLAPKLFLNLRKGTMSTVQHNLGVIRSRLSIDHLNDQYPDLVNGDATLLSAYTIEDTPIFTDANDVTHQPTNKVVTTRDNTGGWVYSRDTGKIYANLPNGAYTKLEKFEIWAPDLIDYTGSSNISVRVGGSEQIDPPANPIPPTAEFPEPTYTLKNSSDSSIATVTDSGLVNGISEGNIIVLQNVSPLVAEITVAVIANPATFVDDTITITELANSINSQTVSGNVATNDISGSLTPVFSTVSNTIVGTYGTFTVASNGDYSYELDNSNATVNALAPGDSISESFDVDVSETSSGSIGTTALTVTINGINDSPNTSNILASTDEEVEITLAQVELLANSSDIENDTLTANNLNAVANATVIDNGNGTFTVTPSGDFSGELNLTFNVVDPLGGVVVSTVTLTVNPINDPPIAVDNNLGNGVLQLGSSDFLTVGVANDTGEQLTSMWFRTSSSGVQGLFSVTDSGQTGAEDRVITLDGSGNLSGYIFRAAHSTETIVTNVGALNDGEWHHLTFSLDGDTSAFYVDGSVAATGTFGTSNFDWTGLMRIGKSGASNYFDGDIKDVQVYNGRGGTLADAQTLMGGGQLGGPSVHLLFQADDHFSEEGGATVNLNGSPEVVFHYSNGEFVASNSGTTVFDVLLNDIDVDGDTLTLGNLSTVVDDLGVVVGTLAVITVDGGDQIEFTSNGLGSRSANFTYEVTDADGQIDTATVAIEIN